MEAILMKAASFIAVIILGYGLRKAGFFKEEDFMYCQRSCLRSHFLHPSLQIFHRLLRYSLPCFCCVLCGFAGGVLLHEPWMDPWRERQG